MFWFPFCVRFETLKWEKLLPLRVWRTWRNNSIAEMISQSCKLQSPACHIQLKLINVQAVSLSLLAFRSDNFPFHSGRTGACDTRPMMMTGEHEMLSEKSSVVGLIGCSGFLPTSLHPQAIASLLALRSSDLRKYIKIIALQFHCYRFLSAFSSRQFRKLKKVPVSTMRFFEPGRSSDAAR